MDRPLARIIAIFAAVLLTGCAALKPALEQPRLNLIDLRLLDAQLLEQRYELTFRVLNPNDIDIPIRGMYFELELEGRPFADGVSNTPVTVPGYGEAEVRVTVSTNMIKTLAHLARVFEGQPRTVHYRLSGHLTVGLAAVGRLPISTEGDVRLAPDPGRPAAE